VTAVPAGAPSAAASLETCLELGATLERELPNLEVAFAALCLELSGRVAPPSGRGAPGDLRSLWGGEEDVRGASPPSAPLSGYGHLHALLLLPRSRRGALEALLLASPWIRLHSTLLREGGRRREAEGGEGGGEIPQSLEEALGALLPYLLKEYRIEASEGLFHQLEALWAPTPLPLPTKFTLRWSPTLLEAGTSGIGPALEALASALGSSCSAAPLALRTLTLPEGEEEETTLTRLLAFYLEETNGRLAYQPLTRRRGSEAEVVVVRPSPLYLYGVLETVVAGVEALTNDLLAFYQHSPQPKRLLLRAQRSGSLRRLAAASALALPPRLLAGSPSDRLVFGDGAILEWGPLAGLDATGRSLLLRGLGELETLAEARASASPDSPPLWARYATPLGWYQFLLRLRRGSHLPQTRRLFHHPRLGRLANQVRLLAFLGRLGRAIRSQRRDDCGILLYGGPRTGKTPFLREVASCVWGYGGEVVGVELDRRFNPTAAVRASVLRVDDATPSELRRSRLKKWMAPLPTVFDRKHLSPLEVALYRKLFLMSSNDPPADLFGRELPAMTKRFGEGFEMFAQPHHPTANPHGYHPEELWGSELEEGLPKDSFGELDDLVPLALIASDPTVAELVAEELERLAAGKPSRPEVASLLRHPPLASVLVLRPGLLLEDLDPTSLTALEETLGLGHRYPFLPEVASLPVPYAGAGEEEVASSAVVLLSQDQWERAVYAGDVGWGEVGPRDPLPPAPPELLSATFTPLEEGPEEQGSEEQSGEGIIPSFREGGWGSDKSGGGSFLRWNWRGWSLIGGLLLLDALLLFLLLLEG